MRRALVIVGKAPDAGRAKTRLVPPLSPEQAAGLYRAFLLDAVDLGLALGWERLSVVHPHGSAEALRRFLPAAAELVEQPGRGIADALAHAFAFHFAAGFERVVLIGSDNPTLSRAPLEAAQRALQDSDVVIGPSADGGYYLLGMTAPHLRLFEDIDWSTRRVWAQTTARAAELGLRVSAVQRWYDVDEPADLERLRTELAQTATAATARHTRWALANDVTVTER
jgi:rSAM/selenodomain-associated transferase 1